MSAPRPTPKIRVLLGAVVAIGPGRADLLEAIRRSGSISAAARDLGMSYRRAWLLVDATNRSFRRPLVARATGGRGGGGARLTAQGEAALRLYRAIERKAARSVRGELTRLARNLRRGAHSA